MLGAIELRDPRSSSSRGRSSPPSYRPTRPALRRSWLEAGTARGRSRAHRRSDTAAVDPGQRLLDHGTKPLRQIGAECPRVGRGRIEDASLTEDLAEVLPLEELHDEVDHPAVGHHHVMDLDDIAMPDPRADAASRIGGRATRRGAQIREQRNSPKRAVVRSSVTGVSRRARRALPDPTRGRCGPPRGLRSAPRVRGRPGPPPHPTPGAGAPRCSCR